MMWIVAEDAQEPTYQGKTFKDTYYYLKKVSCNKYLIKSGGIIGTFEVNVAKCLPFVSNA